MRQQTPTCTRVSPVVVFEDADLDAAVECVVDAIWFNQGQVCCAGSRLIVQENVAAKFIQKLKNRMEHMRVGDPLDKSIDMGAIVDQSQWDTIDGWVKTGIAEGGECFQPNIALPEKGLFYKPTLITGLDPAASTVQEEIFGPVLVSLTFRTQKSAQAEVDASVERLFTYTAWADKYSCTVQETTLRGITVAVNEPMGVIGIACPDENPLLGFISLMAPAIARGNSVVMIPSQKYPLSAMDFYQVLDTFDVPGGVVNIVTGDRDHLVKTLVQHEDVDSVWYFGSAEGSYHVENESAANMKRTWTGYGLPRDWLDREQGEGHEFLHEANQVKNIWVPTGE